MARRTRPLLLALILLLGLAGCGVSTSSPRDIGDGLSVGAGVRSDIVVSAPNPDSAISTVDLVSSYLEAAVGGGDQAIKQVKEFLTNKARSGWIDPPSPRNPTVIRVLGEPTARSPVDFRTPVDVRYEVIGVLNDQGRVEELSPPGERMMTLWVAPADDSNNSRRLYRIDEITNAPAALLLSDKALTRLYSIQPVYFWDAAQRNLIPDLRYLPLTQPAESRANMILQWLIDGPSAWLAGVAGAKRLPTGMQKRGRLILRDGRYIVDFSAPTSETVEDVSARLYYQLRWSLRTTVVDPTVELRIDGKEQVIPGGDQDYLSYNLSTGLQRQTFDIKDQHVEPVPATNPPMPVLSTKDNTNVVYAAVERRSIYAAFVRREADGRRMLAIVRDSGASTVVSDLKRSADTGRPVWVPGQPALLVPSADRLYWVAADGHASDITPSGVGKVKSIAIAPDGRRLAVVTATQVYVYSIAVDAKGAVLILPNPRAVLAGQVTPVGAAWDSEVWLYIAGTANGAPVMLQVTADGVVARIPPGTLGSVFPTDVVAYPKTPVNLSGQVFMISGQAVYPFGAARLTQEPELRAPFFPS